MPAIGVLEQFTYAPAAMSTESMPDDADALERKVYSEILKVATERCPPDYFTLLGISSDVEDAEAVERAAKQQADRLRRGTPKELVPTARSVLKRIERARICISDANSRRAYLDSMGIRQAEDARPRKTTNLPPSATNARKTNTVTPPSTTPHSGLTDKRPPQARESGSVEPLFANEIDLGSLMDGLTEEVPTTLISLPGAQYSRKKSNSHAIVYVSVVASAAMAIGAICLIAYFASADPTATPLPESEQVAVKSSIDSRLKLPPSEKITGGTPGSAIGIKPDASIADSDPRKFNPKKLGTASTEPPVAKLPPEPNELAVVDAPANDVASPPREDTPAAEKPIRSEESADPIVARKELVTEIDLPPLRADRSVVTGDDPESFVDLGYLDEKAANSLQVSLDEPYVKQHTYARFYAQRPDKAVAIWEIRLKAEPTPAPPVDAKARKKDAAEKSQLDGATEGFDEVIASLHLDSSGLKFRWGKTNRATLVEQLRNCALVLTSEGLSHRIQLRSPLVAYKFMFDLSDTSQVYEIVEEHLPQADAIRFEISNVQLPGISFELDPADGTIGKGDTLRIKSLDGSIPVEFQFQLSVTTSKATVRFVPRHQLGRRWYPFTGDQVHGAIEDMQRALADGRSRHRQAESAMNSLPGQLRSIEARLHPDSRDYAQLQSQRITLQRQLNSARGASRRLSKSLPEMEAKLPQLNSLVALGKQIHMQGRLEFRAFLPLGEGELVLLKTGAEAPPSKAEKAKE